MDENKIPIGRMIGMLSNLTLRFMDKTFSDYPCSGSETGFIGFIVGETKHNPQQDIFQKHLEKEFNLRSSTASETIKNLEAKGFLKRESLQNDARKKKLIPTEKAFHYFDEIGPSFNLVEQKLTKGLTEEQIETWRQISMTIVENLHKECL